MRVNKESLIKQLEICNSTERLKLPYCKMLLNNELPETIDSVIVESHLYMLILRKEHISQVQCSYLGWKEYDGRYFIKLFFKKRKKNIL